MPGSMEAMGETAKVLSAAEVETYASQIQALKYNALNPDQNLHAEGTYGEHKEVVKDEIRALGKAGSRDKVIALFDGEKVVGFMSIEKTSPTEAEVKELWTVSSGRAQRGAVRKLLGKAKEYFSVTSVRHLMMNLDSATDDVGYARTDSTLQHFVRPVESQTTESSPVAANENIQQPEAADDNQRDPLEKAA